MLDIEPFFRSFDPDTGLLAGATPMVRRLSELRDVFADVAAWEAALRKSNPVVYTVASYTPADGDGQLHVGIGTLMPGMVGREFFLTKGHLHSWRSAAELYVGLRGEGMMLLDQEGTGTASIDLRKNSMVYVPGNTAHRTINTGNEPLIYLGIYPAGAGHDYESIAARNFRSVVVNDAGTPRVTLRSEFLKTLS